jgi:outer membrane immunogenic protein
LKLNKYLLAAAFAGLASTPTIAADIEARPVAKAPVPAAVYDWTGFYAGINAGVGVGRNRTLHDAIGNGSAYSLYLQPEGAIGGAQFGYNWQNSSPLGPFVLGIEADIQGSGLSDRRTNLNFGNLQVTRYDQSIDWFGTVRARFGWARGPVLGYATAGFAYADVHTSVSQSLGGLTGTFSSDGIRTGWTYGSGMEAALGGNWTGKIEYLYMNLGNRTDTAVALTGTNFSTEFRQKVFRAGLNYRFGGPANYDPVATTNWAGLYLGGNWGSGVGRDRSSLNVPLGPFVDTFNLALSGFTGGVQAGYGWQSTNWVFAVEADFQGSALRDNRTCVLTCTPGVAAAYDATLPWWGTARGRLGYAAGPALFYVTGGYAYGNVRTKVTTNSFVGPVTTTFEGVQSGWTAGAGIETPFTLLGLLGPNWTNKTEYLYVDLGTRSDNFIIGATAATTSRSVTEHVFRSGVSYHFNSPVVAKY